MRERRERQNLVERLRALLDSGRTVVSVGEGEPLDPGVADERNGVRDSEVGGHAHVAAEESDR